MTGPTKGRAGAVPPRPPAGARARQAHERRRHTCVGCGTLAPWPLDGTLCLECEDARERAARQADQAAATRWAHALLARPDWCLLDLETTGLGGAAEIVAVAVLAPDGTVLLDTLVKPLSRIPADAVAIHGITTLQVATAPPFPAVYPLLAAAVAGRDVVTYNSAFDQGRVQAACRWHALPPLPSRRWLCAMQAYAAWYGCWSAYYANYRLQPLPGGTHSALGDCRATLQALQAMATSRPRAGP